MKRNEYIALSALAIKGGNVPGRNLYWIIKNLMPWSWFYGYGSFYIMMRELAEDGFVDQIDSNDRHGRVRSYCITNEGRGALKQHIEETIHPLDCC